MNRRSTKEPYKEKEQFKEQPREVKEQSREVREPKEVREREQPKEVLKTFLNRDISITLRGGSKMHGKLEMVTHFEIIISVDQKPILVMKHAIDYVELTG